MPELTLRPLFDWLTDLGFVEADSMGKRALSWGAIATWRQETGVVLTVWDKRQLRRLSADYLAESHHAEDWTRPAPWQPTLSPDERLSADDQLRAVLLGGG